MSFNGKIIRSMDGYEREGGREEREGRGRERERE